MTKNIIITCGTSLFTNLLDEDFYKLSGKTFDYNDFKNFKDDIRKLSDKSPLDKNIDIDCDDEMGECEIEQQIKKYLISGFDKIDIISDFFKKLSAEITLVDSLVNSKKLKEKGENLNIEKDNVYLFFSDTLDGQLVAEVLEYVFTEKIGIKNLKLKKIEKFIVKGEGSAEIFQQQAIKNYFTELEKIKNSETSSEGQKLQTIMCPVGGYKALIPYSSLYAMVQGWEIKYIYEDSDEIISLPSGSLTNLSAERILNEKIDVKEIFNNENLSNNYSFDIGLKLIFGIKNFIDYGKSKDLSNIFELIEKDLYKKLKNGGKDVEEVKTVKKVISNLKKYLENLSDAFDLIRLKDIKDNILKIKEVKVDNLKDLLLKNSVLFLQKELNKVDLSNIVSWYFERGRYAETILIMREGIIDFVAEKLNLDKSKRENREKIENTLGLFKYERDTNRKYLLEYQIQEVLNLFKGYENFWEKLTQKRNNFAHTNQNDSVKSMINGIKKLYEEYLKITSKNYNPSKTTSLILKNKKTLNNKELGKIKY